MRRYAACVEYDGSRFHGWQRQKHTSRTVQSALEAALSRVADHDVAIVTAGRTDTGVHATHQVIHFESDSERSQFSWCRGTNRFLDHDVRLRWVVEIDDEFHARFSALSRSYRFIILNQPIASALYRSLVTHEYRELSVERMQRAGEALIGEHDFSSFRAAGCQAHSPVRTVSHFALQSHGPWVWFDITANAFLQHMVRNIAGALIEVGCAKREPDWLGDVLAEKDRTRSGITAGAHGLYLVGVGYPDSFKLPSQRQNVGYWVE